MKAIIEKDTLQFLKDLKKHYDRDWFNEHKDRYIAANQNFIDFVQGLIDKVAAFDDSVAGLDAKDSVFRIYRDTRFSKDKTPYKTFMGATLMGKGSGCGIAGYYFHLEPGNAFLAGGVHMTEPKNLKAIREEISESGDEFLKIINNKKFTEHFKIEGEKLANVPKGFDKGDPMGDYLKYKELMIHHSMDDKTILSDDFAKYCTDVFKLMVPFNEFVNKSVLALG